MLGSSRRVYRQAARSVNRARGILDRTAERVSPPESDDHRREVLLLGAGAPAAGLALDPEVPGADEREQIGHAGDADAYVSSTISTRTDGTWVSRNTPV